MEAFTREVAVRDHGKVSESTNLKQRLEWKE